MARVLVTGGTGVLGSRVARILAARGHNPVILSRRADATAPQGIEVRKGDVRTGAGLTEAVEGMNVVVHAASNPRFRPRRTEVDGTAHVVDAAHRADVDHLIYVSIVGVDRIPFFYYRAKEAAERVVTESPVPWTIQRATQFHSFPFEFMVARTGLAPRGIRLQLVDASEVAARLVDQVETGPVGRSPDMGGPEILSLRQVADTHREVTGQRIRLLQFPAIGKTSRGFAEGHNLCPEHADGTITFADYLRSQA